MKSGYKENNIILQNINSTSPAQSDFSVPIKSIVTLHRRAFPDFFLTTLGPKFLTLLYNAFLTHESGILIIAKQNNNIVGFIAGTTDPKTLYRDLKRTQTAELILAVTPRFFRHPLLVTKKVLSSIFNRAETPSTSKQGTLISSIATDPTVRGHGIGKKLLRAIEGEALRKFSKFTYLTTDVRNNEKVNKFYQRNGYDLCSTFEQIRGRSMNLYTKKLVD